MALRRLVSDGCCGAIINKDCDIPGDSTDCFQFHCAVILAGWRSEDESNPATSHALSRSSDIPQFVTPLMSPERAYDELLS